MATAREEIISIYDTLPARYNIGFSEIEVEPEPIALGTLGPIHRGRWGGRAVAVEKFDLDNTDDNFNLASKEMSRMIRLRHPNVLKVYGFCFVAEGRVLKCSMVMELMEFELDKYIEQSPGEGLQLRDNEVVYIMAEIARGMKHVHENGYSHRDLKPQNVLMRRLAVPVSTESHLDVKVADFGSSELMSAGQCDRIAGTSCYKAPEQFDRHASNSQPYMVDVYSFGCICFKLWTREDPPFKNHVELMERWKQRRARNLPGDVEGIITECLDIDPDARPGFSKISAALERQLIQFKEKPLVCLYNLWQDPVVRRREIVEKLGLGRGVDGLNYAGYVILPEEFVICRSLAGGSETTVFEVEWKSTRCALKLCVRSGLESRNWKGTECLDFFVDFDLSRFKMLPTLIHDNIVRFLGYSFSISRMKREVSSWILMELLASDLSNYLKLGQRHPSSQSYSNETKWKLMKGIAEGMKFLHDKDWVHGDLKPRNVVVDHIDDIVVKLIDFNIMRYGASHVPEHSTRYAAPEVLQARGDRDLTGRIDYKKADVYSFAITCSDILGEDEDYGSRAPPTKFKNQVIEGMRPALPKETSEDVRDLISRCWSDDSFERPSFGDICEFFSRPMPVQIRDIPSRPIPMQVCDILSRPMPIQHGVLRSEPTPVQHCCKLL